jgi:hypothetical protein
MENIYIVVKSHGETVTDSIFGAYQTAAVAQDIAREFNEDIADGDPTRYFVQVVNVLG